MSISVTSITSNVLLAIGLPPSQTGGKVAPSRWPGPSRHARHPHGNYVIGVGNYVSASPSELGNCMSADIWPTSGSDVAVPTRGFAYLPRVATGCRDRPSLL